MTIQTAVSKAALRVVGSLPPSVFASADQTVVELRDLAQDVAEDIAASAEWRDLVQVATVTGATSFPLPSDYARMLTGHGVQDQSSWFWGYRPFRDVSEYIAATNGNVAWADPGGWIILGGEMRFHPPPSGVATFPYISTNIVRKSSGVLKATFDNDSDSFVLSERLLTLGLIWRYRAQKGLDYSEDMATYEIALAQAQVRDKGARVLRPDARASVPGARLAYINRGL